MKYLTAEQYARFEQDGYLVVDDFLTPEEVAATKSGIQRVCAEHAHLTENYRGFGLEKMGGDSMNDDAQTVEAGRFRKIQGAVFPVAEVRDVFTSKKMLDCMEDVMGPEIYYHSSKVMFKPPHGGAAKPWHQDAAYWRQYDPRQITVWIAIDDSTKENGCVWCIPGSHKLGLIPHVKAELQVEESRIDLDKAVPAEMRAGGLLIFHSLVLHMSQQNDSDKPRCAIICDYDSLPNTSLDFARWELPRPAGMREDNVWPLRMGESVEESVGEPAGANAAEPAHAAAASA